MYVSMVGPKTDKRHAKNCDFQSLKLKFFMINDSFAFQYFG